MHAAALVTMSPLSAGEPAPPVLDCAPDPADVRYCGRRYAPILWFAADEPIHPTLPHPFAFNGEDDDNDGAVDLADAEEIHWEASQRRRHGATALLRLQNEYRPLLGGGRVGPMAVLHYGPLFAGTVDLPAQEHTSTIPSTPSCSPTRRARCARW
jgi:hypothetical protein